MKLTANIGRLLELLDTELRVVVHDGVTTIANVSRSEIKGMTVYHGTTIAKIISYRLRISSW